MGQQQKRVHPGSAVVFIRTDEIRVLAGYRKWRLHYRADISTPAFSSPAILPVPIFPLVSRIFSAPWPLVNHKNLVFVGLIVVVVSRIYVWCCEFGLAVP